ncbi:hypothetical protein GCM10010329_61420 [Streptomyces spiroverticillatus]|uniref:Peptidase M15C domain-containing protein n=1 Tax=Streptomyces finlayi TaxID=67296 RepID=A0A918X6D8_9ACTN|nr:hypothetical protein [Streptomyces finlayi]GHA29966.1 hypothetical protein GCM10010329_61420 [Streptomyces spiroverticillatus]GHD15175.1 hypothetical protein GCM10010334_75030 [Streptomyces finlayi]
MKKTSALILTSALLAAGTFLAAPAGAASAALPDKYDTYVPDGDTYAKRTNPDHLKNHNQAKARLTTGGAPFTFQTSANCFHRGQGCTSLSFVNKKSIEGIRIFQSKSKCPIKITGGTEWGHAGSGDNSESRKSHWNGYKLDIDPTTCVSNYIKSNYTLSGTVDGNPRYISGGGNWYVKESNHWDITYF